MLKKARNRNNLFYKENQQTNSRNQNAKLCYICKEKFEDKYIKEEKYCKVKKHCHYTGEYRGTTYSICKLGYSVP